MKDKVIGIEKCVFKLNDEAIAVYERFFDDKSDQIDDLERYQKHYLVSSVSKIGDKALIYAVLLQVIKKSIHLLCCNPEKNTIA